MYEYFVSDATFQADQGFIVYFDLGSYSDLSVSPKSPGEPDWDPLVIQPDPTLPSDGFFDALALVKGASLANPFIVTFTWLGGADTAPGVQRFEVYELPDAIDPPLETGLTRPVRSVPEPSTLLLSGLGLALASRFRRSRS
jgi:PEP-CTERM motif